MQKCLKKLAMAAVAMLAAWSASAAPPEGWRRFDDPAPVTGIDGLPHAATCSAYPGTDPTFRFWARRGKVRNLVVYFEGGGACWDDVTCTFPIKRHALPQLPQFFVPSVAPGSSPRDIGGLLDETEALNPVKDWTQVYIPYCTGDTHVGSATRIYNDAGHPVKPLPPQFEIRHRGFDNFMVVLDWIARNVPAPQRVLVAGSSAGGYGAAANFPWIARLFPAAELSVLADGSQGVTTPRFDTGLPGRGAWNPQLAPWVFGSDPNAVRTADLLRAGALAHPAGRFGQFTNVADAVQIGFYGYMKAAYGPGGSCADPASDWNQQMLSTLAGYSAALPNFRSYTAPGTDHTVLRSPNFYGDQGTGRVFASWLTEMTDRSAAWSDATCPDCLLPLACPAAR